MRSKLTIPALLLLHLICAVAYLLYVSKYSSEIAFGQVTYEGLASVFYFGTETLFSCLLIQAVRKGNLTWFDDQMLDVYIGFYVVRGLIYLVDDLNIFDVDNVSRITFIIGYLFICVVWVNVNAYREGYLSND